VKTVRFNLDPQGFYFAPNERDDLTGDYVRADVAERIAKALRKLLCSACRPGDDGKYDDLYDDARGEAEAALKGGGAA
jgi:hypothetical protein